MENTVNETLLARTPAAAAGTTNVYVPTGPRPFIAHAYQWLYEATEGGTDNTFDFAIAYTTDGTNFTTVKSNGNPNGLLETGAPLVVFDRRADAASSGAAALATDTAWVPVRIPANAVVRFTFVTAGTSPVAIQLNLVGAYV